MKVICAFSSDSRTLYQADIYRVLALPKDHIIHFRYKKKWVDDNLLLQKDKLKNQKVAIFYTHGNATDNEENNEQRHISVRSATITHTGISDETNVFHVYMKLDNFCNVSVDTGNSLEKQPSTKYFSMLDCTEKDSENNWEARVLAVKDYFPDITYFHVKGIYSKWFKKCIKYQNSKKLCFYNLTHGDRYTLKLSLGNPGKTDAAGETKLSDSKIEIRDSSEEITINCINPLETSIQFDDYDVPISVKTLSVMKQASLLSFNPKEKGVDFGEYATNIELNLTLNIKRPIIFGAFSTMAFWALLLAKPISATAQLPGINFAVLSTIMFFIASGSLFFWFNKK
jgi:hypothetical protein